MFIRRHHNGWGVWRDMLSSTYALPVTWSTSSAAAVLQYMRYTGLKVSKEERDELLRQAE